MEAFQENKKSQSKSIGLVKKSFFSPSNLQTKLSVNLPGDKYEVEADQVAEQVVQRISDASFDPSSYNQNSPSQRPYNNFPNPHFHQVGKSFSTIPTSSAVQTKCDSCEAEEKEIQRKPDSKIFLKPDIGEKEEELLMAKQGNAQLPVVSPETTAQLFASKGGGDPLPKNTRIEMERGFGVDFSNVRTHTSPSAVKMSKNLGAHAFTHGPDIYFNTGKFDTQSQGGKRLLAHELTHVVQQRATIPNQAENSHHFLQGKENIQKESDDELREIKIQRKQDINIQTKPISSDGSRNLISLKNSATSLSRSGGNEPRIPGGKNAFESPTFSYISQKGNNIPPIQRRTGDGHDFLPVSIFSGNEILEAVFDNERALRNGSRGGAVGAAVRLVQQALVGLGYDLPTFGADGDFGSETERAVRAFQVDVGLGVDGVVGHRTIDFLDKRNRGAEVAPPVRPVTANTPFNLANAIVQPGTAPSRPLAGLGAGVWGFTNEENVQVRIDVFQNAAAGVWQPVLSEVVGNYSLQNRLLPACPLVAGTPPIVEVTGPGGNTNAGNYCAQLNELNGLTLSCGNWFMISAVLAHERVHAAKFRNGLIDPAVVTPLETAIEGITIPLASAANPAAAEALIRVDPRFPAALTAAHTNWVARDTVLLAADHVGGAGLAYAAERTIVNQMITRICAQARSQGWPACPPLCP